MLPNKIKHKRCRLSIYIYYNIINHNENIILYIIKYKYILDKKVKLFVILVLKSTLHITNYPE